MFISVKPLTLKDIVGHPAERHERTHHFAENSSFCQAYAFEVLTRTSTYRQFFICLYVLFVEISHQAQFCLQISHPTILFTMLMGFLNCCSFIIHALLPGTSKVFTLSVFLPGAHVHILLLGTLWYVYHILIKHWAFESVFPTILILSKCNKCRIL